MTPPDFMQSSPAALPVALAVGFANFLTILAVLRALSSKDLVGARARSHAKRRRELRTALLTPRRSERTRSVGLARQLVARLKLSRGRDAKEAADLLTQAGWRSSDATAVFLALRLASPLMLKNAIQKRHLKIQKALPDALDLFVICAEAGLSLDAAVTRVGREIGPGAPELADELGLTGIELGFLPDRREALLNFSRRVATPQVRGLVNTLVQTEKYGTPLAQSLRVLASEFRDTRMMKAEEKAARLPAILTVPMIIFVLPPLFIILIGPAIIRVMAVSFG
jgi:tight adherence protein C